jgi:hypothetical protein
MTRPRRVHQGGDNGALRDQAVTRLQRGGVTPATAKKLSLKNISDLKAKAGTLTLAGPPECRQREDCLLGLQQTYG